MIKPFDKISVSALLDGRKFVIPSYQRGYRWTNKQVDELLEDLQTYLYDAEDDGYYCLQPIIVKTNDDAWELVDGQQRITTLVILLRALLKLANYDDAGFADGFGKKIMELSFDSHPEDDGFLTQIATKTAADVININQQHLLAAYEEMLRWFREDAPRKAESLGRQKAVRALADSFLKMLAVDNEPKHVKVIWYALDDGPEVNPIREFMRINSGKIPLTDAELVKALLLQRTNFAGGEAEQIQHALEWESMENALNDPELWAMVSDKTGETDRMRLVIDLLYRKRHQGNSPAEKGDAFRYFAGTVENHVEKTARQNAARSLWKDVVDRFRLLETWFEDPLVYNYVGLLSHYGESVYDLMKLYDDLPEDATRADFVSGLVDRVRVYLEKIKVEHGVIDLSYDENKTQIRRLLLFLNVRQAIHRIEERERLGGSATCDSGYFKFPFAIHDSQNWNVEHVDSFTANAMRRDSDREEFVCHAKEDYPEIADDATATAYERGGQVCEWIEYVRNKYDCGDEPEDVKNGIGNLVLLDEGTNKSYGNDMFARKRAIIRERIHQGVYVPLCTQWVFAKSFEGCETNQAQRLKWSAADKQVYHDFIVRELTDFRAIH